MKQHITVDNIKCNGCATTVRNKLEAVNGITDIAIHVESGTITFDSVESNKEQVISTLRKWGYPLKDQGSGIDNAKSFVSCMIGRIDNIAAK